jgi:acetylornithine deacetylase/succinyl-diaminopimelate desuccinylase-like protein
VILVGPGSILDAHTADEQITFEQLAGGVALYAELGRKLLTGARLRQS